MLKRALEVVGWLMAVALFAFASRAVLAQDAPRTTAGEQQVTVTVRPAQTVEERVADAVREKELRQAAEEKRAAAEAARLAELSPKAILGRARTIFISSGTSFFEPVQLQNALRGRAEFETWQLMMIDDWGKRDLADLHIEVDRPLFTYTFTYQLKHRATGVVLATGKVTAFDGNVAAPKLAKRIVEEIRKARGEATGAK